MQIVSQNEAQHTSKPARRGVMENQDGLFSSVLATALPIASDRKQDEHVFIKTTPEGTDEMKTKMTITGMEFATEPQKDPF